MSDIDDIEFFDYRILIAEDDPSTQRLFSFIFQKKGAAVVVVGD